MPSLRCLEQIAGPRLCSDRSIARRNNGLIEVKLLGASGKSYTLEAADNLTNPVWVAVVSALADDGGEVTLVDPQPLLKAATFYRIAIR